MRVRNLLREAIDAWQASAPYNARRAKSSLYLLSNYFSSFQSIEWVGSEIMRKNIHIEKDPSCTVKERVENLIIGVIEFLHLNSKSGNDSFEALLHTLLSVSAHNQIHPKELLIILVDAAKEYEDKYERILARIKKHQLSE